MISLLFTLAVAAATLDPAQESRALALDQEIRCVQCQSEPIAQSTAEIAKDMRRLVRERIAAGDSDADIRAFFRTRYGDFVLFRPPLDARTWALWAAPGLLLLAGIAAIAAVRRQSSGETLSPEQGER